MEYQAHLKCIVDQEGFKTSDDAPDTAFYQWVTFMMILQVLQMIHDRTEILKFE